MMHHAYRGVMKWRISMAVVLTAFALFVSPALADPPPSAEAWTQVWAEEFETVYASPGQVNPTYWSTCPIPRPLVDPPRPTGCEPPGNDQLAFYGGLSTVSGGNLSLNIGECPGTAGCDPRWDFVTGMVRSKYKFLYGYFEVAMPAWDPLRSGMHPAFWLVDAGENPSNHKPRYEIDIAEFFGGVGSKIRQAYHWFANTEHHNHDHDVGIQWPQGYHTYGVDWQPNYIRWYVDGEMVHQRNSSQVFISPVPMVIQLTMQVGPTEFTGPPAGNIASGSAKYAYVRAWQHCTGCDCAVTPEP